MAEEKLTIREKILLWLQTNVNDHISIGKRITIFGWSAMQCAVNIRSSYFGFICFKFPGWLFFYGKKSPWYFYISPNGTPWAAWICFGPGVSREEKERANIRRHAYIDTNLLYYYSDIGWRIKDDSCEWLVSLKNKEEKLD